MSTGNSISKVAFQEAKHWARMAREAWNGLDFDPAYYSEQRDMCRARACMYLRMARRYAEARLGAEASPCS